MTRRSRSTDGSRILAKKKKKKKKTGARRPTYATGKKIEDTSKKTSQTARKPAQTKAGGAEGTKARGKAGAQEERKGWNIIRSGTPEMKIFQVLLIIVAVAALLQYPLFDVASAREYADAKKTYDSDLKKFEEKYPSKEDQKAHESEKPKKPMRPTAALILFQIFLGAIWTALIAFLALNLIRRTDLKMPFLDARFSGEGESPSVGDLFAWGVPAGIVSVAPLILGAYIASLYSSANQATFADYSLWRYALFFMSTGVQNQMLFVFLVVTAFVWLLSRYRERLKVEPHWGGITLAALFTLATYIPILIRGGAGAANGSLGAFAVSPLAMLWVFVLGYLYWKKGLEYSLLAGVLGYGLYPLLASLFIK